ncbi:MAG TPA: TlpA disulfide reductase family protein [Gammaproteobacteria bacterium]
MKRLILLLTLLFGTPLYAAELMEYEGAALPDFSLTDMQGKSHKLGDYRGKVVMVNFWATYCGPCIKEMPSMQRLKEKLSDRPFAILAIDMAEERATVEAFLQKHNIQVNFPILLDPEGGVVESWMITAVPTTFIIDPQGEIRYALFGGIEWDKPDVIETISGLF